MCTAYQVYVVRKKRENIIMKLLLLPVSPQTRHRAVNLFLQGYEKSWIEAEEHYFEDKLIEDLAVSSFQYKCKTSGIILAPGTISFTLKKKLTLRPNYFFSVYP